jgi:hypothetical protein
MDFEALFHNFYAYFVDGDIVALWEYCKIHDEDDIVILSIITRGDCRWKWYWKAVVNAMTHKIIEKWLVHNIAQIPKILPQEVLLKAFDMKKFLIDILWE